MEQTHTTTGNAQVTIRRYDERDEDRAALARLAARDSHRPLTGNILGAEIDGRLLAATSLDSGETIADPFARTTELRAMLGLRARALRERRSHRSSRWIGRFRGHAAVGGSPAGQVATLRR